VGQFQVSAVIAEPSAVAPDTKFYSGDIRQRNREFARVGLNASDAGGFSASGATALGSAITALTNLTHY